MLRLIQGDESEMGWRQDSSYSPYGLKKEFSFIAVLLFFSLQSFSQTPDWTWAKRAGGSGTDWVSSSAADAAGNVYVVGHFYSPAITFGSTTLNNSGLTDMFLVKYNAAGNVVWARKAGSTGSEWVYGVAVDITGNVYIAGQFNSPSITFGSITLNTAGAYDIFFAKYDAAGNVLWARRAGGTQVDGAISVVTDASGNTYVAGNFSSPSVTFGTTTLPIMGGADMFLAKYDAAGNALWARCAGEFNDDLAYSIASDATGNVYMTGTFGSTSIAFGSITLTNANVCVDEIFIVKYNASGTALWAKSAMGGGSDYAYAVATDVSGNVYMSGFFYSPSITFGSISLSNPGGSTAIFIAKYDAAGNAQWVKNPGYGIATSLTTDVCGKIYVTGYFGGPSITFGSTTLLNSGVYDIFVANYNAAGNVLWAIKAGGSDYDQGVSITSSSGTGDVYVAGSYYSPSVTFGSITITNGDVDGFIAMIDSTCSAVPLPVELLSFTGKNEGDVNVMKWTTASEINNDYFSVLRSSTGDNFEEIGTIKGAGNSSQVLNYTFTDLHPLPGINYYRLLQTDYNGEISYSNIIAIKTNIKTIPVIISPDPAVDFIQISFGNKPHDFEIEIMNAFGETVLNAHNQNKIDISALAKGIYFLKLSVENTPDLHKFIKQ
ncbi:MAG TPA: T9SS type A sorting domain-containing protein [Bacteroidia bacterium]|nr:T9SS type A sorting domain-containing protein [Bacteroidia bacterium]